MTRSHLAAVLGILLAPAALLAADLETYYELVLAEDLAKPDAERMMKEASRELQLSYAPETLADPPREHDLAGEILCVQVQPDGRFRLTADLEEARLTVDALGERVRARFPKAEVREVKRRPYAVSFRHQLGEARLFILAGSSDWKEADARARELSKASGTAYKTRGLAWDAARGLVFPQTFGARELRGLYYPRQDNACGTYMTACDGCWADQCLSVERSDYYPDLTPGLFVVVSGVDYGISYDFIKKYRALAPDAYVKKTRIFAGIR